MKNKEKKKRLTAKQKIILLINFILLLAVYYGCVYYSEKTASILPYQICTGAYITIALILGAVSLVLSGKITSEKQGEERSPDQISTAKNLLLWVLPLFGVLLIDFIDLFVVQYIEQMLGSAF